MFALTELIKNKSELDVRGQSSSICGPMNFSCVDNH